ncbi:hypothetical protein PLEOSDRAFT_153646 [Pleurotus ostreatus PC15]|uniref:Helitron helicase-like domain-containing protein n=1 Tax=Pleurotus ostreatus (strain PC15) TaxID=1137138 RepID=A0A067P9W5_PLEO1|nr:hypothetical protein PLEOSDRAFT_153646 [Pleurotus ostreatus PC15]
MPNPPRFEHLPPELAQQLANLPPLVPVRRHASRARQNNPPRQNPPPPPPNPPLPLPLDPPPLLQPPPPPTPPLARPQRQQGRRNRIAQLPKARQPFSAQWPVHYLGKMDLECQHCHALHWKDERLTSSTRNSPQFGMCCYQGKIQLASLEAPPLELDNLLRDNSPASKEFRENIRRYNNALAMTSLGCKIDDSINRGGGGPYMFKIQGRLTHLAGALLPEEGQLPQYAQLYIHDPAEALNHRMQHPLNNQLNRETMSNLQDMLHRRHPGVQLYKQAYEVTRNMPSDQQCRIALRYDNTCDQRRYNLPSAASNEIAVILPGDGETLERGRDIILYRRAGQPLQRISELHPLYQSLHYVLLFPTGQFGWTPHIPYQGGAEVEEEGEVDADGSRSSHKRSTVSQTEYFRYRLHIRAHETVHLFRAGKLFQEWIVDSWALSEQSRLLWVTLNQKALRVDNLRGLMDAVAADANATGADAGQRVILPSSFIGRCFGH